MDKIVDRIRKMLALANDAGATPAERDVALTKAHALMQEHGITHIDELKKRSAVWGNWMEPGDDHWKHTLAMAMAELFNCLNLWDNHSPGNLVFVGFEENVEAAEMLFKTLMDDIERWYKEGLKAFKGKLDKADRREFRLSFKQGAAAAVLARVNDIVNSQKANSRALIVVDASIAAARDLANAEAKVMSKEVATIKKYGFGTGAGIAAGKSLKIQTEM